ncbi:tyrosine-type recombinase/integrase [Paracoccus saliphilus]|uniref:tyrosine-type recombinase/integrase n=1 Tax=Paracoccus saliphilus TaxID=405559 RepID=UPI000970546C|nr:integrase arm-type DNA-binding domain-containing protein [Paracoccus saliphilus]
MSSSKSRLSAVFVKSVKEPGKYGDGNGLCLIVSATGAKRWEQRLTIQGKRCDCGHGSLALVSLAEAREKAVEYRRIASAGGDPRKEKDRNAEIPTFEAAAREVHQGLLGSWSNDKHGNDFINSLSMYAFPKIGSVLVSEVGSSELLKVLTPIWTTKNETARRVFQRMETVLKWAAAKEWRDGTPGDVTLQGLPKVRRKKANRKALPYTQVHKLVSDLRGSNAMTQTKLCLEFIIMTATRSAEARYAVWSEIDLEKGTWTIPASRIKMRRDHTIPLSPRAVQILKDAHFLYGDEGYVFPGARKNRPLSDVALSGRVKELGYDATVHGFRTSFRTWTQERTAFPREICESALAHLVGDEVERAYARSDLLEKRRELMEAWADYLAQEQGKVVRIG